MISSVPFSNPSLRLYQCLVALFLLFLLLPLAVVVGFSFHHATYPSLPWQGASWVWYFGDSAPYIGLIHDSRLLDSLFTSIQVAFGVALISTLLGLSNAHLLVRYRFRGKELLSILMLIPLVIPGVILGISILVASSSLANSVDDLWLWEWQWARPGLILVVLGQATFITSITTLVLLARYRRFDPSLEEAALNLGATPWRAFYAVTLPFLRPTIVSAFIVSFLMSFENFNTTLMLVGSDSPLTVEMYQRMREGSTPVINAVSVILMLGSGILASGYIWTQTKQQ
ncbi:ABC transporter permease [Vibrio hippocampi]|uniref:Inner membrane ABC transporter permease protein YdcV n=1 Tax=Vibrio hippocampi TaxID=654686 RepID=A0ABM8ZHN6_9VIBR|nr:ABC transporter permease [Vibrio hippocampi]CAH0526177.1 Inner membrane ABC transporter permease protein YdcV [Vibrio hippocampi]